MNRADGAGGRTSRFGALLRRIPFLRRWAERRWIPDAAERLSHERIVRRRLGHPAEAPPPVEDPAPGDAAGG
jgi:hypothetical protein